MPSTRQQKKAKKSRGLEMLSDIENLDVTLGENHFSDAERERERERERKNVKGNLARKPDSITSKIYENSKTRKYT